MSLKGLAVTLTLLAGAGLALSLSAQPTLHGDLQIHDPTVLKVNGSYLALGTGFENIDGGTLRVKTSKDGLTWTDAGTLGSAQPAWVAKLLGQDPPNLWAPSLSAYRGTLYLYFAASTFGSNTSGIGLMTNAHYDPQHPTQGWQDRGLVFASKKSDDFNAIDPFRINTPDGRAWLSFGSYWDGIKLRELNPETGQQLTGTQQYSLASRGGGAIEASALLEHGGFYYLFVSFDRCCAGVDSTYRIMVGRARQITGPYTDREGVPMLKGGGSQLQASSGRFIGPGGQEVYQDGAKAMLDYHYYDGDQNGLSQLQTAPLTWSADGWPQLGPLPKAP